ncbi:MAG: VCBS repeat-containing protein, partial [Myxococcota bacterium]
MIEIGDLGGGDGQPDVVYARSDDVSVALNRPVSDLGTGSYRIEEVRDVAGQASRTLSDDFDLDGRDEVVTLYRNANELGLWKLGAGETRSAVPLASAGDPEAMAVGDLDGDSYPDVVVVEEDAGVTLMRGTGTGFTPFGNPTRSVANANDAAVGDVDVDGDQDVVVVHNGGYAVFTNGDSGVSMAATNCTATFGTLQYARLAILSGDSEPSLVVTASGVTDAMQVFAAPIWACPAPDADSPGSNTVRTSPYVIDIDFDGRDDFIYGHGGQVRRCERSPSFSFCSVFNYSSLQQAYVLDLNGDGLPDFATARTAKRFPEATAFFSRAFGLDDDFVFAPITEVFPDAESRLAFGDFNADGVIDHANTWRGFGSTADSEQHVSIGQLNALGASRLYVLTAERVVGGTTGAGTDLFGESIERALTLEPVRPMEGFGV